MEPQTACEPTTDATIPNTSEQGSATPPSEPQISKKPTDSEQKTDPGAGKSSRYFTLLDLHKLTFTLDGLEVLNAQDATDEQFGLLADVVANVTNVEQWFLEERRDFCNQLYAWCTEHKYEFPFTIADEEKIPTAVLNGECLE